MTQEELNIIVSCIETGVPALSGKLLKSLSAHLDDFNKYKEFYNNAQTKQLTSETKTEETKET